MNEREINVSFFRFEDLRIYAKAMDYIVWLYQQLPTNEIADTQKFMQKSFLRSAQDIALNTAEGSSRNRTQFLYYLKMAKSSVRECVVHTEIAFRSGVLTEEAKDHSRNELMEIMEKMQLRRLYTASCDLLTADEVRMLDNRYALLFIRGEGNQRRNGLR